jgi:predicted ATPase
MAERDRDEIFFADLTSFRKADFVMLRVTHELSAPDDDCPVMRSLIHALRGRRSVLVFDNCEQVAGVCASLSVRLLSECSDLRILVAGRKALGLPGESIFVTPPLAFPREGERVSSEEIRMFGSLDLFFRIAKKAKPQSTFTQSDVDAAAQICRSLGGIPLAIEAAAAATQFGAALPAALDDLPG